MIPCLEILEDRTALSPVIRLLPHDSNQQLIKILAGPGNPKDQGEYIKEFLKNFESMLKKRMSPGGLPTPSLKSFPKQSFVPPNLPTPKKVDKAAINVPKQQPKPVDAVFELPDPIPAIYRRAF